MSNKPFSVASPLSADSWSRSTYVTKRFEAFNDKLHTMELVDDVLNLFRTYARNIKMDRLSNVSHRRFIELNPMGNFSRSSYDFVLRLNDGTVLARDSESQINQQPSLSRIIRFGPHSEGGSIVRAEREFAITIDAHTHSNSESAAKLREGETIYVAYLATGLYRLSSRDKL